MAESNTKIIIDVSLNSEDATKKAQDLGGSIKAIKEEQKGLKASGKETDVAYQSNATNLRLLTQEQKAYISIANAADGSNHQLSAQISLLTQQYNALGREERDNSVAGKALQVQLKSLSEELKGNKEAVGDHRMSVGDYEKANRSATESIAAQKNELVSMSGVVSQMPIGFKLLGDQVNKVTDVYKSSIQALRESKSAQQEFAAAQQIATEATKASEEATKEATAIGFQFSTAQQKAAEASKKAEEALKSSIAVGEDYVDGKVTAAEAERARVKALEAERAASIASAEAERLQAAATKAQVVATNTSIVATAAETTALEAQTVATASATNATKIFKLALASTGIGALIVLIAGLTNYLSKFKPLTDAIEQGVSGVSAAFEVLGDFVFRLIQPLQEVFTSPKKALVEFGNFLQQNIINRFRSFGVIIDAIRTGNLKQLADGFIQMGTGATNATDKISKGIFSFSKNISQAAKDAANLTRKSQDLDDAERKSVSTLSKLRLERDRFAVQAKNTSLSEAERIKLLDKATQKETEAFKVESDLANQRLKLTNLEIALDAKRNNGREASDKLQEKQFAAQAKVNDLEAASLKFTEKRYNDQARLREKSAADSEKSAEKSADAENARLESLLKTNDSILTEKQREIESINQEINEKIEKYRKYGATTEQLEKERTARLKRASDEFHKQDLAAIESNIREIEDLTVAGIKNEGDRRLAQFQINQSRELAELEKQTMAVQERIDKGETGLNVLLKSYDDKKTALLIDGSNYRNELVRANYQVELDDFNQHQVDLANAAIANAGTDAEKIQAKQTLLDSQYQQDMDHANLVGQDTTLIVAQYEAAKRELQLETINAVASSFKSFSSSFQSLTKENSTAYKLAGAVQAKVDAAQALRNNILIIQENIKAIASQGKLPFPFNIVAIVSTLAALGSAVVAAKTLVAPVALASGGVYESDGRGSILSGPGSGTSDSINARLSNGEAVINAKSTEMYKPLLSIINQAGGGAPLAPGYSMAAGGIAQSLQGGHISQMTEKSLSYQDIANIVIAGVKATPPQQVDVREITTVQMRSEQAKVRANL